MFDQHEPERTELNNELKGLERQLSALTPVAPRIDRDKLMFAAGQAAADAARSKWPVALSRPKWPGYIAEPSWLGRVRSFAWPAATATMTAVTLLLSTMLVSQRRALLVALQQNESLAATQVVAQPHELHTPPTARPEMTTTDWTTLRRPGNGYLGVRYTALTRGVGALDPMSQAASGSDDAGVELQPTQREMLNELLPSSRRQTNSSS